MHILDVLLSKEEKKVLWDTQESERETGMVRKREKGMKDFFLEGRVVFHPSFYLHAKVIILIRVWKRRKYLCINKDSRNRGNSYIITHKHRQTTLCSTHTLQCGAASQTALKGSLPCYLQSTVSREAPSYMLTCERHLCVCVCVCVCVCEAGKHSLCLHLHVYMRRLSAHHLLFACM